MCRAQKKISTDHVSGEKKEKQKSLPALPTMINGSSLIVWGATWGLVALGGTCSGFFLELAYSNPKMGDSGTVSIPVPIPIPVNPLIPTPIDSDSDSKMTKNQCDSGIDSDSGIGIAHLCSNHSFGVWCLPALTELPKSFFYPKSAIAPTPYPKWSNLTLKWAHLLMIHRVASCRLTTYMDRLVKG